MDDGIYEFILNVAGDKVKARYSLVYTKGGDSAWKIAHHYSSQIPEEVVPKASLEIAAI